MNAHFLRNSKEHVLPSDCALNEIMSVYDELSFMFKNHDKSLNLERFYLKNATYFSIKKQPKITIFFLLISIFSHFTYKCNLIY